MSVFLIAEVKLNDDSWVPDYAANVHNIAEKHGGKYLSRSGNIEMLEGEANETNVVALIEFPSADALKAFVNDPDYAPYAKARQAGTDSRLYMVDDSDATGGIPYLPAG
jgi:uncharacterized protein (DUF1330 family)